MTQARPPMLSLLTDEIVSEVVDEAKGVLSRIGVRVEHAPTANLLLDAGAQRRDDGRICISAELVERAIRSVPRQLRLYDREGTREQVIGGGPPRFVPGSAGIRVLDHEAGNIRPSTLEDCTRFAQLIERLDGYALQSTCVVPSDVPHDVADLHRLFIALTRCHKPIITGTIAPGSFRVMLEMLVRVRGSADALREKPLAIFDCCPTAPLAWSELTVDVLVQCGRSGIPAELISVPMTGATAPATLLGAVVQHTAENLSGVVIHQLAGQGSPLVYGGCPAAFDMRHGTPPMGAIETMMLDAAHAQVGRRLGFPTHGYLALSDSKALDYQAGLETGLGALVAALSGIDIASGAGMLELINCQSLEKLVLDHEACAMAQRARSGIVRREGSDAEAVIAQGVEAGQFLKLKDTRRWFRKELHFPGSTIDRQGTDGWISAGRKTSADRAHEEVQRLLGEANPARMDLTLEHTLQSLLP